MNRNLSGKQRRFVNDAGSKTKRYSIALHKVKPEALHLVWSRSQEIYFSFWRNQCRNDTLTRSSVHYAIRMTLLINVVLLNCQPVQRLPSQVTATWDAVSNRTCLSLGDLSFQITVQFLRSQTVLYRWRAGWKDQREPTRFHLLLVLRWGLIHFIK